MNPRLLLSDVLARGVEWTPQEAVAVAQQLIDAPDGHVELLAPLGPPSVGNVTIDADGLTVCHGSAATPAVAEIGALLQSLLPGRIPGGLRYTIARSRLEVDAPPFDSITDLAAALNRYEPSDRLAAVAQVFRRVEALTSAATPAMVERRASPWLTELHRRLREADEELFLARQAAAPPVAVGNAPPPESIASRTRVWAAAAVVAAACSFAAGYAGVLGFRAKSQPDPVMRTLDVRTVRTPPVLAPNVRPRGVPSAVAAGERQGDVVAAASTAAGPMYSPAFETNGSALFFHTGRNGDAQSALASMPLDRGLEVMTIVDDGSRNYHVQPSPDGTQVAFDSDRDGERGVYLANRDGSAVRRISGSGFAAVPTWSPDGLRLAFIRAEADRPHVWNLWLTSLATGEARRLTEFRYGQTWNASWFPDGGQVAYSHEDRLFVLDLDSGRQRVFASPIKGRLVRTPAVSPDARHIVFQVSRSGAWMVDVADGSMRCVLTDPTAEEFAWSPDGRRVAYHSRRDGQWGIWLMAPEG